MVIVRVVPSSPCGGSLVANPKFSPSAAAALTASTAIPKFVNDRIKCSRFAEPSVLVVAASTSRLKVCTAHRNVLSSSWCYPTTTTWATLAQNSQTHTETVVEPVKPEKPQMGMLSDPQLAVLSDIGQTRIRNGTKEARECSSSSSSSTSNDSSTSIITHSGLQESSTHSGPPVLGSNHNWERTIAALQDCIGSGQNLHLQEMKEKKKKPVDDMLHNLAKAVATIIFEENLPTEKIMAVVNEIGLRVEVRSMNMVIWELGQLQDSQGAGNAFQAFRAAGVEPNTHVCTTLIAIYGYVRQLPLALELFKWMEQKEMARPLYTFNALIVACGRSGASNDAIELFEEMQKLGVRPDRITYVGVISATTASGQWDLAQSFIRKMQAEGYRIEEREYTEMLWACARARKPREALGLFQEMLERGYRPTLVNYNSLLSAYEKAGQWEEALRTFVWIQDDGFLPDIMSWSTLISACASGGQAEIASEVLERMKASGCRPNIVSWCALIKAHQKIGNWKGAERTFEAMLDDGCVPNESRWHGAHC
ncbi:hypothetical protein BDL97_04G093100 [Sphagnum fallax]|nr:hypothetical protein BDL97_04G093100 [Sphagnum fallax]KAH8964970.1 hypothetical protein BDL97_04G093100 [Sphagnum fallax]KAH8964971.1 hypothetical protein BDL97_04G093100 [Sphagnum fallax]